MRRTFLPILIIIILAACNRNSLENEQVIPNKQTSYNSQLNSAVPDVLILLGDFIHEYSSTQPAKALLYANTIITESQKIKDKAGEAWGYYEKAVIYEQSFSSYLNAMINYYQSLLLRQETGNQKRANECLLSMAGIYYKVGLYDDALKYYQLFLEGAKKVSNKIDEATAYRAIALVYRESNNNESISYLQKALIIYEALGNKTGMADCYNSLASTYYTEKKYNEAKDYYLKTLSIREQTKDKPLAEVYFNLGLVYGKFNDPKTSSDYLTRCLQLSEEINYLIGIINSDFEIANTYYKQKSYQQSISELNKALIVAEQLQDKQLLINITQLFSDCYTATGDQNKAREYEDRNTDLKEEYRLDQMKALQIQNQQRNEVERFAHGKFMDTKGDRKNMIWFIAILVGLISGAGITFFGIKRRVVEKPMIKLRDPNMVDLSWWQKNQLKWINEDADKIKELIRGLEFILQDSTDESTKEMIEVVIEQMKEKLKTIQYWANATNDINPTDPPPTDL